ncbi:MAG: efflux transporter outer membrane subunit [Magnetospirillum gryphiswaldense]|nr:efflux transporter outer membrane subunit [Magnetospirillum gryphiswaldense]
MSRPSLIAMAAALLASCSQIPDHVVPDAKLPADWAAAAAPVPAPHGPWWQAFGVEELNRLQDQAAANNHDLAAAIARIEQAKAQLGSAEAGLWPSLDGSVNASRALKKAGSSDSSSGSGSGAAKEDRRNTFTLGLSASYEVDFWGKNRAAALSAEAGLAATQYDRDVVARTLAADLANAYFAVLALRDRLAVTQAQLDNVGEILAVIEAQESLGATSGLELAQQRSVVAQLQSSLSGLELQHRQALSALALLLGETPSGQTTETTSLDGVTLPNLGAGLPSDLLRNRPDIRAAEARLIAANADIGLARAQLFPSLTLSASGTATSTVLNTLSDPISRAASMAAALTAPIFDAGKLRAGVELAEAKKRELIAGYQQTVLTAFVDVHDALNSITLLAQQAASQQVAEEQAAEAYRIAAERYRAGAVDYQTLLETQRTVLQTRDAGVQLRLARMQATISLARGAGGALTG